jgi:lipopolysaccharide transport system ATP-binding protein
MSVLSKVEARGLTKAFPLRKRARIKGIATDSAAAFGYFLRQTLLPRTLTVEPNRTSRDFLFALDDVSFDVPAGEVLGIIGRNGAGKSTLLRILARILDPTAGRVLVRGRVVSLLELGIGFAPDLSVGENIQIYGRLAGIPAAEIREAEDRILEFSRLTEFRDIPLQNCPSGSAVQLAFSAMIGFDADIILADEVLTVGDAKFRHACEERIRSVGRTGESVLFVSHDMNAIRRTCTRVMWIDKGRIRQIGPTEETVRAYVTELLAGRLESEATEDLGSGCRLLDLRLLDGDKEQIGALQMTEPAYLDCVLRVERPDIAVTVQFEVWQQEKHVFTSTCPTPIRAKKATTFRAGIHLPADFLNERPYRVRCRLFVQDVSNYGAEPTVAAEQDLDVSVMNPLPHVSVWSDWDFERPGLFSPRLPWTIVK